MSGSEPLYRRIPPPARVCAAVSESSEADPTAQERALLRYYYYVHNGIETGQVAPMALSWLHSMDAMLTPKLRVRRGNDIQGARGRGLY